MKDSRTEEDRQAILERVKTELGGRRKKSHKNKRNWVKEARGSTKSRKKMCEADVERVLNPTRKQDNAILVGRCHKKGSQKRRWAQHNLQFCKEHVEIWDNICTWALIDFYIERGLAKKPANAGELKGVLEENKNIE